MNLILPKKLSPGDAIGIVCPSAGISPKARHRLDQAQEALTRMGFRVLMGDCVLSSAQGYVSGSIADRVHDLHAMFSNPDVRMIVCGIGGNHTNQLLEHLDYSLIRKNPKIVIGYSDITVLHFALYTQAGLISYYGPCAATQFGEFPTILEYTRESFIRACTNELPLAPAAWDPSPAWTDEFLDWFQQLDRSRPRKQVVNAGYNWLRKGKTHGKALPGCILSMNRLAGTRFWINPAEKILCLDILQSPGELDEALVDSFLTDLSNLSVFEKIRGLVIGRPFGYSAEAKQRFYNQLLGLTRNKKYPIVTDVDLGHTDPMVTIRYDQMIELDGYSGRISSLD